MGSTFRTSDWAASAAAGSGVVGAAGAARTTGLEAAGLSGAAALPGLGSDVVFFAALGGFGLLAPTARDDEAPRFEGILQPVLLSILCSNGRKKKSNEEFHESHRPRQDVS
jgi:hypothetical protein